MDLYVVEQVVGPLMMENIMDRYRHFVLTLRIYQNRTGIAICRIINQFDDDNSRNGATEQFDLYNYVAPAR